MAMAREDAKVRSGWYVVQSQPQMESVAIAGLTREGFLSVFPKLQIGSARPTPLFARYIFTRIEENLPWRRIWRMNGVSRILGGEMPDPVQAGWVEKLQSRLIGDILQVVDPRELLEFLPGDRVRIVSGLFEGCLAECVWSSVSSLVVDFMMGAVTDRVRVDAGSVEHYPPRPTVIIPA